MENLKPNSFETVGLVDFGPTVYVSVGNARESCREEDGTKYMRGMRERGEKCCFNTRCMGMESKSSKHSQTNQFQKCKRTFSL